MQSARVSWGPRSKARSLGAGQTPPSEQLLRDRPAALGQEQV